LSHVPIVRTVYDAARKIGMMLEPRDKDELKTMTPVLCNFGGPGGTAIPAFMPSPEVLSINGRDYRVVMIPTAPIPFGGAIFCVPAEWVTPMNCGIDGLFNIYMSMGVTMKDYMDERVGRKARWWRSVELTSRPRRSHSTRRQRGGV
ncbi:MAG: DUF502 domain-containing protein, partial [Planctomycetota bacterium]